MRFSFKNGAALLNFEYTTMGFVDTISMFVLLFVSIVLWIYYTLWVIITVRKKSVCFFVQLMVGGFFIAISSW